MSSVSGNTTDNPASRGSRSACVYRTVTSLKCAMGVVLLIAVACIAGTLLPQGRQVEEYLAANPDAAGRMRVLDAVGLTHVYDALWFKGLLGFLGVSLLICTTRRYRAVRRSSGRRRIRAAGSLITHISMLIILVGAVVRGVVGQKGFMSLHEGERASSIELAGGGGVALPFSVRLVDFDVEFYSETDAPRDVSVSNRVPGYVVLAWRQNEHVTRLPVLVGEWQAIPGSQGSAVSGLELQVRQYVPDFLADMTTGEVTRRSDQPNNPAIQVSVRGGSVGIDQWLFARFPRFKMHGKHEDAVTDEPPFLLYYELPHKPVEQRQVKDWRSTLEVVQDGQVVLEKTIEVNDPLRYAGYTFFQSGYNPNDPTWTSLQVVKDPGVPVVYTGFILMVIGLCVLFCVEPLLDRAS